MALIVCDPKQLAVTSDLGQKKCPAFAQVGWAAGAIAAYVRYRNSIYGISGIMTSSR